MRTIKELLEVMLENKKSLSAGLCWCCRILFYRDVITRSEFEVLHYYIQTHRVNKFSSINAYKHRNFGYWWKPYSRKPRIKWIKKHIKINS